MISRCFRFKVKVNVENEQFRQVLSGGRFATLGDAKRHANEIYEQLKESNYKYVGIAVFKDYHLVELLEIRGE